MAKNNSQTDDHLNIGGDHTVNGQTLLGRAKHRPPCVSELPPVSQTLGRLEPSEKQDEPVLKPACEVAAFTKSRGS